MYSFVRQNLEDARARSMSGSDVTADGAKLQSYKCGLFFFKNGRPVLVLRLMAGVRLGPSR